MNNDTVQWPKKTRELHNHHLDSTVWNDFKFRDDDIILTTWGKTGTTWVQQIVAQLLFDGAEDVNVSDISPWFDARIPPKEEKFAAVEAQTHRRFLKSHLPVDALVFSPKARYIYVARDGRDIVWSLYNHHAQANEIWYQIVNDTPGRVGPPIDKPTASVLQYFRDWLEKDGYPLWAFWENVRSWWEIRNLPNVMFLHFKQLKEDMPGQIRRIADYLEIPINESKWPTILEHCSFEYMKKHADRFTPGGGIFWHGGGQTFIYKGTDGRWQETLTPEDVREYEEMALRQLGPECAHWLATGEIQ